MTDTQKAAEMESRRAMARSRLQSLREQVRSNAHWVRSALDKVERQIASGQPVLAGSASTATESYFQSLGALAGFQAALSIAGMDDVNQEPVT